MEWDAWTRKCRFRIWKPERTPTAYPENDYMRGLVYSFAEKWPDKKTSMGV